MRTNVHMGRENSRLGPVPIRRAGSRDAVRQVRRGRDVEVALFASALALLVLWARAPAGGAFVRSLPQTLSTVRDGLLVLTQVLVLTVLVLLLLAVLVWLSRDDDRTQLLPFQNATVDASLTAVASRCSPSSRDPPADCPASPPSTSAGP